MLEYWFFHRRSVHDDWDEHLEWLPESIDRSVQLLQQRLSNPLSWEITSIRIYEVVTRLFFKSLPA